MAKALVLLAVVAALAMPHLPPVGAPISDRFRPPETAYGPGNRGLEYRTVPGEAVRASADGVVAFSGTIGAEQYVSIQHSPELRTTYSFLATRSVSKGQRVRQGDKIGTTGNRFHFGAKRNGVYIDPETLFGVVVTEIRLVEASKVPS